MVGNLDHLMLLSIKSRKKTAAPKGLAFTRHCVMLAVAEISVVIK